jgi:hypothetical protein
MLLVRYPVFTAALLYLDPGSGSFLIQLLLAVLLGAGVAVRMYWNKIKGLFSNKTTPSGTMNDGDNTEE